MEVLDKFGINYLLLAAQVVNFLIIFFIVKKYALKPILQVLQKRKKTIEDGLRQAEEARVMLEQAGEKERALLKKAHDESKALLLEAKAQKETLLQEAEVKMRKTTEKMLQEAKAQIEIETQKAQKQLSAHVSQLAVTLIESSASEMFTKADQKNVLDNAIRSLKKKSN